MPTYGPQYPPRPEDLEYHLFNQQMNNRLANGGFYDQAVANYETPEGYPKTTENTSARLNQQRIAEWAGRPVKAQNKAMKNQMIDGIQPDAFDRSFPRSVYNQAPTNPNLMYGKPYQGEREYYPEGEFARGAKTKNLVTDEYVVNRLARPIGRLPAIAAPLGVASGVTGAMNMPDAYQNFLRFTNQYGLQNGMQRYVTGDDSRPEL